MFRSTKVYHDKKSGDLRSHIPRDIAAKLGWKDYENAVLRVENDKIWIQVDYSASFNTSRRAGNVR